MIVSILIQASISCFLISWVAIWTLVDGCYELLLVIIYGLLVMVVWPLVSGCYGLLIVAFRLVLLVTVWALINDCLELFWVGVRILTGYKTLIPISINYVNICLWIWE